MDMTETTPKLPVGPPVADSRPRAVPNSGTLRGHHISLIPMDPIRDAPGLFAASHGTPEKERVWTYMPAGPFEDANGLRDSYRAMASGGDPHFYTVTDNETGNPLGVVSFLSIEPDHGAIEIGHIWYATDRHRTELNTEGSYLLLREAFDRLMYRRVLWKCDSLNERSRAAALRMGFVFEGISRNHRIVRGRNRDTANFSIIDAEWPGVRAGMKLWLEWDEIAGPRPSLSTLTAKYKIT